MEYYVPVENVCKANLMEKHHSMSGVGKVKE